MITPDEPLSPELALVDPDLARRAILALPDRPGAEASPATVDGGRRTLRSVAPPRSLIVAVVFVAAILGGTIGPGNPGSLSTPTVDQADAAPPSEVRISWPGVAGSSLYSVRLERLDDGRPTVVLEASTGATHYAFSVRDPRGRARLLAGRYRWHVLADLGPGRRKPVAGGSFRTDRNGLVKAF